MAKMIHPVQMIFLHLLMSWRDWDDEG